MLADPKVDLMGHLEDHQDDHLEGSLGVGHSSFACSLLGVDHRWWVGHHNRVDRAIFGVEDRKKVDNC